MGLVSEKHKMIIDEKLEGYKVIKVERINYRLHVTLIDRFGYKYHNIDIYNIKYGKIPEKFHTSNIYTIENIKLWCLLNNKEFLLLSTSYKNATTKLKWKCLKKNCGEIFYCTWNAIHNGVGCGVCDGRQVTLLNCLHTKSPEVAKEWHPTKNKNLTIYNVTSCSNKRVWWKCTDCGHEYNIRISDKVKYNISCSVCGDKISYPNKFFRSVLNQLHIKHETEKIFDWAKNKRYDNYIDEFNCIIEVHGGQHSLMGFESLGGKSLEEEKENDILKEKLAKENGIDNYITIDATYSNLEHIKQNILNTKMAILFDLSRIDWLKCHESACSNMVKKVCDLWVNEKRNVADLCKILKLSKYTIIRYLKQGAKIGWCDYDPKKEIEINNRSKRKAVIQLDSKNQFIKEWNSATTAAIELNINRENIYKSVSGRSNLANGFKWMRKEDYQKYIEEQENRTTYCV